MKLLCNVIYKILTVKFADLHIGHIAGAYLPADIFVRYQKSINNDVVFICGSDEHGAAITIQAKKNNVQPKDIINKYHELNKKSFKDFGIDFSIYDRTSDKLHHETAQETFKFLEKKNIFTKKTTNQFYDLKNKQFDMDTTTSQLNRRDSNSKSLSNSLPPFHWMMVRTPT